MCTCSWMTSIGTVHVPSHLGKTPGDSGTPEPSTTNNCWPSRAPKNQHCERRKKSETPTDAHHYGIFRPQSFMTLSMTNLGMSAGTFTTTEKLHLWKIDGFLHSLKGELLELVAAVHKNVGRNTLHCGMFGFLHGLHCEYLSVATGMSGNLSRN